MQNITRKIVVEIKLNIFRVECVKSAIRLVLNFTHKLASNLILLLYKTYFGDDLYDFDLGLENGSIFQFQKLKNLDYKLDFIFE